MMTASIAIIAQMAAVLSPFSTAVAIYEPSPGNLIFLFMTVIASLCATKNQPPPKDIIEFQIRLCMDEGTSRVPNRCQRDKRKLVAASCRSFGTVTNE